ncbi:MAG: hypothetical protein HC905_28115 [Bacteroidales bacterium]|nr:hypothetical protein [Bacteroidales bacterium]
MMGGAKWSHVFSNSLSMSAMAGRSNYDLSIEEDVNKPFDISKIESGILYDCFRLNFSWAISRKNSIDFGLNAIRYMNNPGELSKEETNRLLIRKKCRKKQEWNFRDIFQITLK